MPGSELADKPYAPVIGPPDVGRQVGREGLVPFQRNDLSFDEEISDLAGPPGNDDVGHVAGIGRTPSGVGIGDVEGRIQEDADGACDDGEGASTHQAVISVDGSEILHVVEGTQNFRTQQVSDVFVEQVDINADKIRELLLQSHLVLDGPFGVEIGVPHRPPLQTAHVDVVKDGVFKHLLIGRHLHEVPIRYPKGAPFRNGVRDTNPRAYVILRGGIFEVIRSSYTIRGRAWIDKTQLADVEILEPKPRLHHEPGVKLQFCPARKRRIQSVIVQTGRRRRSARAPVRASATLR